MQQQLYPRAIGHGLSLSPTRVEGGELFDRVVDVGKFTEPIAKLLFYQMLVAVKVDTYLASYLTVE